MFVVLALFASLFFTRGLIEQPGYTDAFYYFNAANRLVVGDGLTDAYLWTYIGLPDGLPAPSHRYWMPLTSLIAAAGMWLAHSPGDYAAAQIPFTLMLAGTACVGFWLGGRIGGTARHAWVAGLLALFSGFFTRFWGMTDTFTPYALVGSLALVFMGLAADTTRHALAYGFWAGIFAGLGHLTRADGLLLLLVGWWVILLAARAHRGAPAVPGMARMPLLIDLFRASWRCILVFTLGYLMVMLPWFFRNITAIGTPLPVGGTQAIWYTEYNDIFNYPPGAAPHDLLGVGLSTFVESRWTALVNNLGTFIAVEGLVVMTPLMLLGWRRRRRAGFLYGFAWYAFGLHLVMTLVFPFPGYRGGLFHSAAALVPWWSALGVAGLDDAVDWIARYRRTWKPRTAKWMFSFGLVVLAVVLSISVALPNRVERGTPARYRRLVELLPADSRVMINDPAQLYYFSRLGGVVLPNSPPDVIPEIAARYGVTHVLIEFVQDIPAMPTKLVFDFDHPPAFLIPVPVDLPGARLYAIQY